MKNKQKQEIRQKDELGIMSEITKKKDEIFKARLDLKTGKLKDTSCLKRKSDELAVLKTLLRERKLTERISSIEKLEDGER